MFGIIIECVLTTVVYEKAPMLTFLKVLVETRTGVDWSFEDPKNSRGEVW